MDSEFATIRFFPSLVAARSKTFVAGEIVLEDKRTRLERERRGKQPRTTAPQKKTMSAFRPTKEIISLSELREQVKKRKVDKQRGPATAASASLQMARDIHGAPFRPCNPSEAKATISSPRRQLARNPFQEPSPPPVHALRPAAPVWRPSGGRGAPPRADRFLNAPDVESKARRRRELEKRRRRNLVAVKDKVAVLNKAERNETLFRYLRRVAARSGHLDAAARASPEAAQSLSSSSPAPSPASPAPSLQPKQPKHQHQHQQAPQLVKP